MQRAGNDHLLTVLSYPNAGHLIEPPFTPFARASVFKTMGKAPQTCRLTSTGLLPLLTGETKCPVLSAVMALWGGEVVAHSVAQEDAWRKTLSFLRQNLYGGSHPGAETSSHL